jgi:hypothetical protein
MASWAVEAPSPPFYGLPFDGWDGCNVWVSVDNGKSFSVAVPTSPAYNCSSLCSFGSAAIGWDMGVGIPGWAGNSRGWMPVEFDLSQHKADSVVIRFAFSADNGISTFNDPSLNGFLIDEIIVADGSTILFANRGAADSTIHAHGNAGWEKTSWLTLSPGAGVIPPNSSLQSELTIDTRVLAPGRYRGVVFLTSNESTYVPLYSWSGGIHVDLEVKLPTNIREGVAGVPAVWSLDQNYPNPFNPSTMIHYQLPMDNYVIMKVYDLLGREVAVLVNERKTAGSYSVHWDAGSLGSGVYFYRLTAGSFISTRKCLLVR